MAESNEATEGTDATPTSEVDSGVNYELKGKIDTVSVLYVVGGIPCMIAFFVKSNDL